MAWSYVQGNGTNNESTGSSPLTVAYPSSVGSGDFLCCAVTDITIGTSDLTLSDNLNGDWIQIGSWVVFDPSFAQAQVALYCFPDSAGGSITVTAGDPGQVFLGLAIAEYSGIAASSPLDQDATATGTGTSVAAGPTATIGAAAELVIGVAGWDALASAGTLTAGSGFTLRQSSGAELAGSALEDLSASSASGQSMTGTLTKPLGNWGAIVAVFKLGGGTPVAVEGSLSLAAAPSGLLTVSLGGEA